MKIVCLGGGAAGLYFAISMKLRNPAHEIDVIERNRPGDTFGWGVVFSDQTMDNLRANDPRSAENILEEFAHWDDIDVHFKDRVIRSGGHGFCGIGRKRLLNILEGQARLLGINIHFETEAEPDVELYKDYDLIIASDGINSRMRGAYADKFGVHIDVRANKFLWLGAKQMFDAFTFIFKETEHGWIWAHAYKFDADTSTFIVECAPETYDAMGFEDMSQAESCRSLEALFSDHLGGHELDSNAAHLRGSAWLNFNRVLVDKWHFDNVILLGDAAHTAHFSIGSGTKLAFEDAIELADVLNDKDYSIADALEQYQETRQLEVLKLQSAARNSTEWFENLDRYLHFEPEQFAYSLMTRSQRVSHENLRERDKDWLEGLETWFANRATGGRVNQPMPPMFTPLTIRDMALKNRVVVSPMCMYSAVDGTPGDFHLVHLASRATGGAGLVYTEMTNVSADGRISPGCAGIYKEKHVPAWSRIVDYIHRETDAKIAIQLGHAGPKGSTKLLWEGMDEPLDDGNWPIIAASEVPWSPENQVPRAMTRNDMNRVIAEFEIATRHAAECGFDMLELHAAHGYLLSSFITPITNKRTDEYGGPLENRLRFPLEVFAAMRAIWPAKKPMAVRISASDWRGDDGVEGESAVRIGRAFVDSGADIIDVSAGQTSTEAEPVYGRMFQTPLSDQVRNEGGVATMAVGNIFEADHVNGIIAAGRADLCCLARPHLLDPYWTLRAAAEQHYHGTGMPAQYESGFDQLERNLERKAEVLKGQA